MQYEPNDLDRIEIFYEEVGKTDLASSLEYEDPAFLEEVDSAKGLSATDVSLLSQDLSTPDRFEPVPTDATDYE